MNLKMFRSHFFRLLQRIPVLAALIASLLITPAHAQYSWQIDPQGSFATLSLGSAENQLEVGVARVSGKIAFDSGNRSDPVVTLQINDADPQGADYASMNFRSTRVAQSADGKLLATGELSVTRMERSIMIEPNEAYAGPQYGKAAARTKTLAITLVLSDPGRVPSPNSPANVSGSFSVHREDFSQLVDALELDDWPTQLINNEKCENPPTIGEDYHGPKCTGTLVATVENASLPTGVAGGEGFYGFEPIVTPDRNRATIALDLTFDKEEASRVASR